MNDYIDFNRKYKDIILGKLEPNMYYEFKEYITDLVDDLLEAEAIKLDDMNKFIDFSMAYLLSRRSVDKILEEEDDAKTLGDIVASYVKFNEQNGIKNRGVDLSKFINTKRGQEKDERSKFESESIKYISAYLKRFEGVLANNTNFKALARDVYESLLFDGYKDAEIINGSANRVIVNYIRNRYFELQYSKEFDALLKFCKEKTNDVFRENEKDKNLTPVESNYYSAYKSLSEMAFRVAVGLTMQNVSLEEAKKTDKLYGYINNNIQAEISRIQSVRKNELKQIRKQTKIIDFSEAKKDFKKKAVAFAVAFGIFAADNIIYNWTHDDKKEDKTKKEPTTYSSNEEYKPGSYLENIDWESITRASTGKTLDETLNGGVRGRK